MSLLSKLAIADAPFIPYLNTGALLDLMTGQFIPGVDGSVILNGGIASTDAVMGRPQVFKSTTANGLVINAMARYPRSETIIFDTEFSLKDKSRLARMSDLYMDDLEKRAAHLADLESRMVITDPTEHDLETFFQVIKSVHDAKVADPKSYIVETPLLDPKTGMPRMMMVPTFIIIDSWSKGKIKSVINMLEQYSASDSKLNTIYMAEGNGKNKILGQLPQMAARAGIYFTLTAHIGNKFDLGSYLPSPKDMQYMKQSDTLKGVGSDFMFLISNLREVRSPKVLVDSNKECEYPFSSGFTSPSEMSSTTMVLTRCKNNVSGTQFSPVVSQTRGYESSLTNYNYLRENGYYGLGTNKVNPRPSMYPTVTFTRKTANEKLQDYKTARAIEITAQLKFIQSNWSISDLPVPFNLTPDQLTEALDKAGCARDDILESRGWWTYDKTNPRNYLSLWDILAIVDGSYKPKFLTLGGITPPAK